MPRGASPEQISTLFSRLAPRYDLFNRLSSLGLDGLWRRALAARLSLGQAVLDVGCGTGDLTLLAAERGCRVVGLDFSPGMLKVARQRAPEMDWVEGSAAALPFADDGFDAVVSAYVLRNLYRGGLLDKALTEAFRVLKPGGRVMFLDLTRPKNEVLRRGHGLYMKTALPLIGRLVCGPDWPGEYLMTSIEDLPPEEDLNASFAVAGFTRFSVTPFSGGIVSLFSAGKT